MKQSLQSSGIDNTPTKN